MADTAPDAVSHTSCHATTNPQCGKPCVVLAHAATAGAWWSRGDAGLTRNSPGLQAPTGAASLISQTLPYTSWKLEPLACACEVQTERNWSRGWLPTRVVATATAAAFLLLFVFT